MNPAGTKSILSGHQCADIAVSSQDGARRRNRVIAGLLMIACVALAFSYMYDAPYWDEWMYVEPVARAYNGELTWRDFVVRVNEHVYVTSSLMVIPLARMTQWDMRYEIGLVLVFYAGTFSLLVAASRRSGRGAGMRGTEWVVPCMALLLFSPSQHALWNWGLHVSIATAVFFLVAGMWMLSVSRTDAWRLVCALLFAWLATYSIGGGLSVWPAGTIAILFRQDMNVRRRLATLAVWLASGVAASGLYIWSGEGPPSGRASTLADWTVYVLAYLGGPLAPHSGGAAIAFGIVYLVIAALIVIRSLRSMPSRATYDAIIVSLLTVGITVGVLTALKHVNEGAANAISSRFLPWATLSWCGVLLWMYREWPDLTKLPRLTAAISAISALFAAAGWGYGSYKADERYDAFVLGRVALMENNGSPEIGFLHPEPKTVETLRPLLVEHRLTVFRERDGFGEEPDRP